MGSEWLGRHQASLFGTVQGNASVVALTLSSALLRLRAAVFLPQGVLPPFAAILRPVLQATHGVLSHTLFLRVRLAKVFVQWLRS